MSDAPDALRKISPGAITRLSTNPMHQAIMQFDGQLRKARRAKDASSRMKWRVMEPEGSAYTDILARFRRLRRVSYGALLVLSVLTIVNCAIPWPSALYFWVCMAVGCVSAFFVGRGLVLSSRTREHLALEPVVLAMIRAACEVYAIPKDVAEALTPSELGPCRIGIDPATGSAKVAIWAGEGAPDGTPAFTWLIPPVPDHEVPFARFIDEGTDPLSKDPTRL